MGKAELSKMSPFQLIVSFMIAELAAIPIESPDVSLISGVTAIFTLLFLQVLISFLSLKSEKLKTLFSGTPSVLIEKGQIKHKELKKLRVTITDLMEQMRIGNCPSISEVEYAIMESNGDLSIIPKADKKPLTPNDLGLKKDPEIMPVVFITDGTLYRKNVVQAGWTQAQLEKFLLELGISDQRDVFLAFCDADAKLHVFLSDQENSTAQEVTAS